MFSKGVTLRGGEATVVHVYQTAAVCKSWTVSRSEHGHWTLSADVTRADPFRLRQSELLFRAPRKGGFFCWPVITAALVDRHLSATLGPPLS